MNNPTNCASYKTLFRRADIEESKWNVAKFAISLEASYPYGNFSDTNVIKGKHDGS